MEKLSRKIDSSEPGRVPDLKQLLGDIRTLIEVGRSRIVQIVNTKFIFLHWHIGDRITREVLKEDRAEYEEQVVKALKACST